MTRDKTPAQLYALLFGAILLVVGIAGFVADSSFATGTHVLWLASVDAADNVLHPAIAVSGLVAGLASSAPAAVPSARPA
jgi:uncharacterized protein (UPF0333 family)